MNIKYLPTPGTLLMASSATAEMLVNDSSKYCLDIDGEAISGGVVRMWKCERHANQAWTINKLSSDLFRLRNLSSNLCLDTDGLRTNDAQVRT